MLNPLLGLYRWKNIRIYNNKNGDLVAILYRDIDGNFKNYYGITVSFFSNPIAVIGS